MRTYRLFRVLTPTGWLVTVASLASMVLALAIVFLSVRDNSQMTTVAWIPPSLAGWADHNPDLRTAIPFLPLCLLAALVLEGGLKFNTRTALSLSAFVGVVLLLGVELSQLFVASRTCSAADVLWGLSGIGCGTALAYLVSSFYRRGHGSRFIYYRHRLVGLRTRLVERVAYLLRIVFQRSHSGSV